MKKLLIVGTLMSTLAANSVWATTGKCNTEEAVKTADQLWASTLALHDPAKIAALYEKDAVLLGTYENIPLLTTEQRTDYFKSLFAKVPNIRVEYDKTHVLLLSQDAISSGLYTFVGTENGKEKRFPARYTFAYNSTDQGCELMMHHSSVLPVEYTNENEIK
jgi:hypothetical protein